MIPRRVRSSVWLAAALHGIFILAGRYRLSYDAYTHMFFGDHYRLDWWSIWEPRWYTGFEVTSYPPLVHQLIGLVGRLTGVDAAYALLLWIVLALYPLGVYAFSRIFTGRSASGYAALSAAVLPSIYLAGHTFGQLPTLTGTLFALFAMAALNEFLLHGKPLNGTLAVALTSVVMAAHHATLLFLPWAAGAVFVHVLLHRRTSLQTFIMRFAGYLILAVLAGLVVVWPFWVWGMEQSLQVPIDHPSRHNFFLDPSAPGIFFLPVYGPLLILIPFVIWKGIRRQTLGLWLGFTGLFILGLGGTTALPRLLFRQGWQWLTYDRFAFWASLLLLPFFGIMLIVQRRKLSIRRTGRVLSRQFFARSTFAIMGLVAVIAVLLPVFLPTQPPQLDMQPVVSFLSTAERSRWRYITLGMGDQFAYLSRLTTATTIDGSYHTARSLPELRVSGIGQIDSAYWIPNGLHVLDVILEQSGSHGVRWAFVNSRYYLPVLKRNGWIPLERLSNGVQVWENPGASLPVQVQPPVENPLAVFSWGTLPLVSLVVAGSLAAIRLKPLEAQRALSGIQRLAAGMLPLGLSFWYFRTLVVYAHQGVYFTYDHLLFFASDGLALLVIFCWGAQRLFLPFSEADIAMPPFYLRVETWFLGLCSLATLSILWSVDWRTSLYFSLHLWLVCGLFFSLRSQPSLWRPFALGCLAALFIEAGLGVWQFAAQSTGFLVPLGLNWPGSLTPTLQGASVVTLPDGARWLRAYGSLPHPNILGGLGFVLLVCVAALYLLEARFIPLLLVAVGLGFILIALTFSRSAWLAVGVSALILVWRRRAFEKKRSLMLLAAALASLAILAVALSPLIFARSGGSTAAAEVFSSTARGWLTRESLQFISERPLTGLGVGAFIVELSRRASFGYIVEPVHNLPLLITSELGLAGMIMLAGLAGVFTLRAWRAGQAGAVIFSAAVAGLGLISLFDHYLWTLAPGRLLLGAVLGLWAGQVRWDAANH